MWYRHFRGCWREKESCGDNEIADGSIPTADQLEIVLLKREKEQALEIEIEKGIGKEQRL